MMSPPRTKRTMALALDYYEALIGHVKVAIAELTANGRMRGGDTKLCEKRREHLETILEQIKSGFEEEYWWELKRPLRQAAELQPQTKVTTTSILPARLIPIESCTDVDRIDFSASCQFSVILFDIEFSRRVRVARST